MHPETFCRDHPRICGEKSFPVLAASLPMGSPPRMRGKAWIAVKLGCGPKDHPRVCGEKLYAMKPARAGKGSPPRMRGKELQVLVRYFCRGITPAYAGKSSFFWLSPLSARDHPRVCGEKWRRLSGLVTPHGITPAYAGKSRFCYCSSRWNWDHPRVCGEKTKKIP